MRRVLIAIAVVVALVATALVVVAVLRTPKPVTSDASEATARLFDELMQRDGVRFGQQLALTVNVSGGPDAEAVTGDVPAIIGWDTLAFDGSEPPKSLRAVIDGVIAADRLGAVSTLSAHLPNPVTGGDYADLSGDPVTALLNDPAPLDGYLDQVAELAAAAVDDDGELIPIIFRPFHEGNGTWFWWAGSDTSELYRYAVTYLRDGLGVTNLLYAWSPNGPFNGDEDTYLATYPGDDVVDILGLDFYESSGEGDYLDELIPDLAMVSRTADARGKIAALTEFGRNGDRTLRPSGNDGLTFFTDLLDAIEGDPDARRIAYLMTWANWGQEQFYVPYPGHEMAGDFEDFASRLEMATPE